MCLIYFKTSSSKLLYEYSKILTDIYYIKTERCQFVHILYILTSRGQVI